MGSAVPERSLTTVNSILTANLLANWMWSAISSIWTTTSSDGRRTETFSGSPLTFLPTYRLEQHLFHANYLLLEMFRGEEGWGLRVTFVGLWLCLMRPWGIWRCQLRASRQPLKHSSVILPTFSRKGVFSYLWCWKTRKWSSTLVRSLSNILPRKTSSPSMQPRKSTKSSRPILEPKVSQWMRLWTSLWCGYGQLDIVHTSRLL